VKVVYKRSDKNNLDGVSVPSNTNQRAHKAAAAEAQAAEDRQFKAFQEDTTE
jgi:hypothetical protein